MWGVEFQLGEFRCEREMRVLWEGLHGSGEKSASSIWGLLCVEEESGIVEPNGWDLGKFLNCCLEKVIRFLHGVSVQMRALVYSMVEWGLPHSCQTEYKC